MSNDEGLRPVTPVGVLAERLEGLLADLDAGPSGRDGPVPGPGWVERLREVTRLAAGLEPYVAACTSPASPALRALEERTLAATDLEREMLSGQVEGRLLAFLVRATRARQVLEIGMFTGYAALAMAEALPAGAELVACEIDADVAALARECLDASPAGERVSVRLGPADRTLRSLAEQGRRFDLVFLDADKVGYTGYLDLLLGDGPTGGLLAPGALVCVDNTLLQGEPWALAPDERSVNGAAIADFNRRVADDPRVEQVLVPLRDGVTLLSRVEEPEAPAGRGAAGGGGA